MLGRLTLSSSSFCLYRHFNLLLVCGHWVLGVRRAMKSYCTVIIKNNEIAYDLFRKIKMSLQPTSR